MKNLGLDIQKEIADQSSEDWVFGATIIPDLAQIPEHEREKYLPPGEIQHLGEDKMDCVTRMVKNILETKLNYLLKNKKLPLKDEVWLKEKGYVANEGVELSDRFIAILSGTTKQGNSLKAPLDAVRKYGAIPKKMFPQVESWDEYYSGITDEMLELGKEFTKRFAVNYQKVYEADYPELMEEDLLGVAGYAWPSHKNGIYPRVEYTPNHAFVIFKNRYFAFDNYIDPWDGNFLKMLAPDYNFLDHGYRITINLKPVIPQRKNWIQDLWRRLKRFLRDIF